MADTASDSYWALTTGNRNEVQPAVSPDGNKIVYTAVLMDFDLVEAPLDGSPPRTLLSTSRWEAMPAWSSAHEQFVYVTNRSGPEEIWLKSQREGWARPLVTARDFPNAPTRLFLAPVFSPDGTRIAYTRVGTDSAAIWITPVSGGSPVRLTTESASEFPPAWSPDGNWLAYVRVSEGKQYLVKARLGGREAPIVLKEEVRASCRPGPQPENGSPAKCRRVEQCSRMESGCSSRPMARGRNRSVSLKLYTYSFPETEKQFMASVLAVGRVCFFRSI